MLRRVLTAACLCLPSAVHSETRFLSGQELSDTLAGAAIEIDAPLGYKLPVSFGSDGTLAGEARDLAFYLGSEKDSGRWWVKGDQVCHKWKIWLKSEAQCLRLKREGRVLHWLNQDGETGTARITQAATPRQVASAAPLPTSPLMQAHANANAPVPQLPPKPHLQRLPEPVKRQASDAAARSEPAATTDTPAATAMQRPAHVAERADVKASPGYQPRTAAFPAQRYDHNIFPDARPISAASLFVVTNVRDDDVLNVRSGPSAEYDVVAALRPGSRGVAITGECRSDWCPVQHAQASGWVHSSYLASEGRPVVLAAARTTTPDAQPQKPYLKPFTAHRDPPGASRTCLTPAARALLQTIEEKFGRVQLVSTCRPGATIAGSGRPSRHASGNAVDFNAGARKAEILRWLIANHKRGGTMTYPDMDHVHVDIGPHFVSIAGGRRWASWNRNRGGSRPAQDPDDD